MELRSFATKCSVFLLLLLFACSKRISPEMPQESYANEAERLPQKEVSYITVPIDLRIDRIENQINAEFKGLIYNDDSFDDDDLKLKIWKQKDLHFFTRQSGVFEFEVPLKIWVEKRVSVLGFSQSPSTQFEIIAKFSSKPYISSAWQLQTVTNAQGFDWISEPKINVGGFTVSLKGLIGSVLDNYQGFIARKIDEAVVNEVDMKTPVLAVWNELKQSRKVNEEYNIWANVEPQDVLMSDLITSGGHLTTKIAIKAYIHTSLGQTQNLAKPSTSLPPLKFAKNLPEGFKVNLYNLIKFEEAERIVNQLYKNETFTFNEGKKVVLKQAKIYGGKGNKLIIQLETSGDLEGTVYLKGDPYYNIESRQLALRNTDFDLKTKNILMKAASWVIEGNMEKKVEREFGIPVDPIFEMAKTSIDSALHLNYRQFKLMGGITEIKPKTVELQPEGLMSIVEITGNLDVKL